MGTPSEVVLHGEAHVLTVLHAGIISYKIFRPWFILTDLLVHDTRHNGLLEMYYCYQKK
jgi:hypothetical protein